jgi:protein-S-isoprenylcysteine O-methyltransferase Ste14
MNKATSAVATALFTLFVPLVVAGVVPQRMLRGAPIAGGFLTDMTGGLLVVLGTAGYIWCATLFVEARGTPAPIAPTKRAVVGGPYRVNRNPMYTSVAAVIFGQAILYGSSKVAVYGVMMLLAAHLFVVVYEEPTLRRQFDGEYEEYCRRVPRWIPNLSATRRH